jgi:hypothetical protein
MARVKPPLPTVRSATLLLLAGAALSAAGCAWQHGPIPFLSAPSPKARPMASPSYPARDAALLGFAVLGTGAPFHYALVPGSITQGRDGVMRYVAVITAADGVRNVFYEGIRCATGQYETYAVGSGAGPFEDIDHPRWRPVTQGGAGGYRRVLYRNYLCDSFGLPRVPRAVLRALRGSGAPEYSDGP